MRAIVYDEVIVPCLGPVSRTILSPKVVMGLSAIELLGGSCDDGNDLA